MFSRRDTLLGGLSVGLAAPAFGLEGKPDDGVYVVPIRITSDRLWTYAELNPGDQYFAIFDSGALTNMISAEMASRLKLRSTNSMEIEGLGGTEKGKWVELLKPNIGGAYQPDSWWFLTSKTLDKLFFRLLIGGDTLIFYNSEFDLSRAEWRIHTKSPLNFGGYSKVENSYRVSNTPGIGSNTEFKLDCTVGGLSGDFHFDTGSPTNFVLDGSATAKLGLWDSRQPYAPWRIGGFGTNRVNTRLYRVKDANIHGLKLEKPLVMLSDPKRSTSSISGFDGLVGLKAIRHFNFLLDAKGKAIWLKPNGLEFEDMDGRYPMSGLWLDRARDAIVVEEVGIGSPAAEAGIAVGDQIVAEDWQTLMTRINGDAGETISLQLDRKGVSKSVEFTLRPYL